MNARLIIENGDRPHKGKPRHELLAGAVASADELVKLQARKLELLQQHKKGLAQQLLKHGAPDAKAEMLDSKGIAWEPPKEKTDEHGRRKWVFTHGSNVASVKILSEFFGHEDATPQDANNYSVYVYEGGRGAGSFLDGEDFTASTPEEAVATGLRMAEPMLRSWSPTRVAKMTAYDANAAIS